MWLHVQTAQKTKGKNKIALEFTKPKRNRIGGWNRFNSIRTEARDNGNELSPGSIKR